MAEASVGSPLSMHDPRQVGPWTVHSRLGAGGMGVVYYASMDDQYAALKVIRPGLLDTPATRDRFRREVQVLGTVRDEHICRYLDAALDIEPAWLAMEYLEGPVLRDEVAVNGPIDEAAWWSLAEGLASALAALAENRITHRDLKPGNVILADRGPVLIDFGIANPEDATSLTATGLVTGSPAWLSPEQANLEPTGPATDVFSLGSLLAFAATGRPPFGEGASVAVLMSIIKREPDLEGIDPVRAHLLGRMLAKDPALRPTAREVQAAARSGAAGTLTVPEPDATRVAPAPDPTLVAASPEDLASSTRAAGPASVLSRSPVPTPPPASPAPTPGTPAPPPPRTPGARGVGPRTTAARRRRATRRRWLLVLLVVVVVALGGWLLLRDDGNAAIGGTGGTGGGSSQGPAAPASDELVDGDWLLESYRLENTDSGLVVPATIRNRGEQPASAELTVWVFADQEPLGSVSASVSDVPPDGTQEVTLEGDAVWKPGDKTVLLQAN